MSNPQNTKEKKRMTNDEVSAILEDQLKKLVKMTDTTLDVYELCALNKEMRETAEMISGFIFSRNWHKEKIV